MIKNAKFWNKVARKYSRDSIKDMDSYEYALGRTKSYLKPTDRVLELGAGTSSTALLLASSVGKYVASDISDEMVAIGREKLSGSAIDNLEIEVGDVNSFHTAGASFDVIMGFNVFHLTHNPQHVFSQIHAMLPKGGLFISKTPCLADDPRFFMRMFFKMIIPVATAVGFAPRPVHLFKIGAFEDMIERAGFEIVESGCYPAVPPSRHIVARKL